MAIVFISGGCSRKNKPVGFQFKNSGSNYFLCGSSTVMSGSGTDSKTLSGDFRIGQDFRKNGCKLCGNKYVYQCGNCGSFVCYDGKETKNAECPVCHKKSNIPATRDDRIVRSGVASNLEILMAIDISGSMSGKPLKEVKSAAVVNFSDMFPSAKIALVTFESYVKTACEFTEDHAHLKKVINNLGADGGTTSPLPHIKSNFPKFISGQSGADRYIVLLTDGVWSGDAEEHVKDANDIKNSGVKIITIGCQGADMDFLRRIASQGANIEAKDDIKGAYATAAKKISQ